METRQPVVALRWLPLRLREAPRFRREKSPLATGPRVASTCLLTMTLFAACAAAVPPPAPPHASPQASRQASPQASPPSVPPTWREVAPLFNAYCTRCHRDGGEMGEAPEGLVLLSHEEATDTGKRARVVPGKPEASELLRRVRGQSWIRMPLDGPPWLSAPEEQLLADWIAGGARDAKGRVMPMPVGEPVQLGGTLTALWAIDGLPLVVGPQTVIERSPKLGDKVDVRGTLGPQGEILVTQLRRP